MVATRGRTFKRPWRRSCHSSKLKSSSAPIGRKDSWCFHAVGSSNAPLLGSTAAEGSQRIGRTSIATRWRFCGLPQSASCSRLRGLFVEADFGGQVHRNHPPLSRGRPDHSGRQPRQVSQLGSSSGLPLMLFQGASGPANYPGITTAAGNHRGRHYLTTRPCLDRRAVGSHGRPGAILVFVGRGWGQQWRSSACAITAYTMLSHGLPRLVTN